MTVFPRRRGGGPSVWLDRAREMLDRDLSEDESPSTHRASRGGQPWPSSLMQFDIDEVMRRVREAVQPYPKPALFALADQGFRSPFDQLVACIISIRTRDEVTEPVAREFLRHARTPEEVSRLTVEAIDRRIRPSTFHEAKAPRIRDIARRIVDDFGGVLPCDEAVLRSFTGVGPKCANLVLGIACGQPRIAVDTHVHRIVNRWGYVHTRTPEQTLAALEAKLPKRYWIEINRLLIPFSKFVCTGRGARSPSCPVHDLCSGKASLGDTADPLGRASSSVQAAPFRGR